MHAPDLEPAAGGPGPSVAAIRRRGHLIAGVDQNTLLLGYANPLHRQRIEGFEIDLLHELSRALFGRPDRIVFRALTTSERFSAVQDGTVDIVVDAVTINCDSRSPGRLLDSVYLSAGQRLLVPATSHARSLNDLSGKRVCATQTSTSGPAPPQVPRRHPVRRPAADGLPRRPAAGTGRRDHERRRDPPGLPGARPVHEVIGGAIESEPYGMAISKRRPDLVRWVNGQLARMRADGTWRRLYRKWLPGTPRQPPVHYRD